jgi:hypothetical protein
MLTLLRDLRLASRSSSDQRAAAAHRRRASLRVDEHPTHGGEVDHDAAVRDGMAGDAVSAPAHGDRESVGCG